uniref:cytosolic sulfotransferase 17-like n=1 Tax=Erigeron canadensis TaxID=72917 RepID=UPI001CB92FF8|nr:cytosolic sulfotransferase 17-like [Erigeron canadensis]
MILKNNNPNMSSSDDDQEKTRKQHAQLIKELPKTGGWFQPDMFLYQGQWLIPNVILGATLMQNHFKHRSADIFLSSFMKTGTTWLKSLMFSIINRSRFDFSDHPLLHQGPQSCFPVFDAYISQDHAITNMDNLPSPRLFASHLAYSLFPSTYKDPSSGCKFVYVCRDPKDVFVSKFHFMKNVRPKELPVLSINEAFELFCEGLSEYGPYWDHVLGFWKASLESPNKILFLRYEEMKRVPEVYVKKLAEFMGVPISAEEEENGVVEKIVELCSFEHLKNLQVNKTGVLQIGSIIAVNNHHFFRRGEVGDWHNHLTKEMGAKIDQITQDKFNGSGLTL